MGRPNILLLTIDCLRYDRCGFNGHERNTTPTLDRLAQESMIFDAAVAPGPRTSESVPGILAGVLSADCMFYDELAYKAIPTETPTIATWLQDHGYRTLAAVSNPQLSPIRNFDHGFDQFANLRVESQGDQFETRSDNQPTEGVAALRSRLRDPIRERIRKIDTRLFDPSELAFLLERTIRGWSDWPTIPGEDVATRLMSMLDSTDDNLPFFAWSHFNDLHAPLHPRRVREGGLLGAPSNLTQYRWDLRRVGNRYEPNYGAMYDSMLRYIDNRIGDIVKYFQKNGLWKDTIIIVTADHGEALYDRGVYGHAAGKDRYAYDATRDYMFDELLHIPLLVREPGRTGGRIRSPFSLVWLHELLAEVADLEPGVFPRQSGRGSHRNPTTGVPVIADAISPDGHTISVRQGGIKRISECLGCERGSLHNNPLIFNLAVDPGERFDVSDEQDTPVLDDLTEQVFTHPDSLRPLGGEIDSETREMLEQLGYQ